MRRAALLTLALVACGDPSGDYPRLAPLEQVLAPPLPAHALGATPAAVQQELAARQGALAARAAATAGAPVAARLRSRAEALAARAAGLTSSAPPADLAARIAALRARAAALAALP